MDKIALVKGEDTLPPSTGDDCSLVVRAAFLPYQPPPSSAPTQLVAWFYPQTCQPSLIERIDGSSREALAWQQQAPDCVITETSADNLRFSFSCRAVLPTLSSIPPPLPVQMGKRTMHVALAGAHGDVWHDGYLAHCAEDGQVLSLLTAPGRARLFVPQTPSTSPGIEPAAVEFPPAAHYLRLCLRAHLASVCHRHGLRGKFTLALDDAAQAAMLCVVLLKSLHDIEVVARQEELTPTWLRLLQNLGVRIVQGKPALTLSSLSKLVPAAALRLIAQDINSQAAVIPAKALR